MEMILERGTTRGTSLRQPIPYLYSNFPIKRRWISGSLRQRAYILTLMVAVGTWGTIWDLGKSWRHRYNPKKRHGPTGFSP